MLLLENKSYTAYEMADTLKHLSIVIAGIERDSDYGLGELYTPVEVHTVSLIAERPGITATEIAQVWRKTKGAVSQIIKQLEGKQLIQRQRHPEDSKKALLFVTEKGKFLVEQQRVAAEQEFGAALARLMERHSYREIEMTFDVLSDLLNIYQNM